MPTQPWDMATEHQVAMPPAASDGVIYKELVMCPRFKIVQSMVCSAALALAALASSAAWAEANPYYVAWKSFKPGTMIRMENRQGSETRYKTITLVAVTPESLKFIETSGTVSDDPTGPKIKEDEPSEQEVKAIAITVAAPAPNTAVTTEEDVEITIAGQKIKAHRKQTVEKHGDSTETVVEYLSDAIPGGMAWDTHKIVYDDHRPDFNFAWKVVEIKEIPIPKIATTLPVRK